MHTLRSFYYGHNSRSDKRLEQGLELIKSAVLLTEDKAVVDVSRLTARMLAEQLQLLHDSIKTYEKEIAAVFARHPDQPIFDSFPGAGPQFAPRLLTAFGSGLYVTLVDDTDVRNNGSRILCADMTTGNTGRPRR